LEKAIAADGDARPAGQQDLEQGASPDGGRSTV
jgi:hypothetical protein